MVILTLMLLVVLLLIAWQQQKMLSQIAEIAAEIHSLRMNAASHQRSIGVTRSNPGATPTKEKAYALPRTDIPTTGRQTTGLRFERKGGPDGGDTPESRLRQRGRRAPKTLRRTGGEAEAGPSS